jgi:hypothetical protein
VTGDWVMLGAPRQGCLIMIAQSSLRIPKLFMKLNCGQIC